ncbi:MAG: hypothetical protein HY867_08400 [Chloroflexi bacterium]|nr:hypothetical protein [Chloroflexota bacterium]
MKIQIKLALTVLAIAALACGLGVPGITTTEAAPTPIVPGGGGSTGGSGGTGATEAPNPTDVPANPPSGRSLFDDDFRGRDTNWGVGTDTDSSVEYVNDALQFKVFTQNFFVWSQPTDEEFTNVHIEVTANNASTDSNVAFGIMCAQQFMDDSFYYVYITPAGDYGIVKSIFVEDDVELASGFSDLIPQNASSYRIGADCGNGVITLYVNGQQIATGSDAEYTTGRFALFVWSDEVANGADITYDDFVVTEMK